MLKKFLSNCKKPQGKFGKMVAKAMNKGHARLWNWANEIITIEDGEKILDVGCGGGGNMLRMLRQFGNSTVDGVDYSQTSVECSKDSTRDYSERCNVFCADVENMPFADGTYDMVFSLESIYFWNDPVAGLKEIARVLKDGGKAVIVTEMSNPQKAVFWTKRCDGMNIYSPEQLRNFMNKAGFEDINVYTAKKVWCLAEGKKSTEDKQ